MEKKIGIVYATKTSHSKKLAEAIGKKLGVKAEDFKSKPAFKGCQLLFIAGGIYGGASMPEFLEYLRGLDAADIKSAALVTSTASLRQRQSAVKKILEDKGIKVLDEFHCRGGFLFVYPRHPNEKDLKDASDFAAAMVKKI
jgi:flavodoxin